MESPNKRKEEKTPTTPLIPPQPFNATLKLQKRKNHWENQFTFEFNQENANAQLKSRIANAYTAAERAAKHFMLKIPKIALYNFKFHPELDTPPQFIAKQMWNHFETFGFDISPICDRIRSVDLPKP